MDVAVVGIDALDPDLVDEFRDDLPTLDRLVGRGSAGRLRSSDPPLTCPAWPTVYTGKQGGKHGVFGFTTREPDSYERRPVDYEDVRAESLWEVLDDAGLRCGVANVPLTYPPSDLEEGFVLSGWPVPNKATVSSPPAVVDAIEAATGEPYEVNPFPLTFEFDELDDEELFAEIREGLWHHHDAFAFLADEYDLDVFFCVYMAVDIASHNFAFDREYLRRTYVEMDRALGELLETIPDETDVVLLSDHGHGARGEWSFHVNEWLKREGFLATTASSDDRSLLQRLGVTQSNYVRLKNALGLGDVHEHLPNSIYERLRDLVPRSAEERRSGFDPVGIDWPETTAYSGLQNVIFQNTDYDHPKGTVSSESEAARRNELVDRLAAVPHPDDERDEPLMSQISRKEELFEGPYVDGAPDVVFVADKMQCNAPMGFSDGGVVTSTRWGEHRQYGTLVTAGSSFANDADAPDAHVTDVLPLVCALLDIPYPENVDGSPRMERFRGAVQPATRESRDAARDGRTTTGASDSVVEQLEGLGYLE